MLLDGSQDHSRLSCPELRLMTRGGFTCRRALISTMSAAVVRLHPHGLLRMGLGRLRILPGRKRQSAGLLGRICKWLSVTPVVVNVEHYLSNLCGASWGAVGSARVSL